MDKREAHQGASAFRMNERFVIHSDSKTEVGVYVASEPFIVLDIQASPGEIGEAVLRALLASKAGIVFPADLKPIDKKLFKAAKVSSHRQFQQSAIHCGISKTSTGIQIDPSHNGGTRGDKKGFQYRPERRLIVRLEDSPEQLGLALLRAFDACTSIYETNTQSFIPPRIAGMRRGTATPCPYQDRPLCGEMSWRVCDPPLQIMSVLPLCLCVFVVNGQSKCAPASPPRGLAIVKFYVPPSPSVTVGEGPGVRQLPLRRHQAHLILLGGVERLVRPADEVFHTGLFLAAVGAGHPHAHAQRDGHSSR